VAADVLLYCRRRGSPPLLAWHLCVGHTAHGPDGRTTDRYDCSQNPSTGPGRCQCRLTCGERPAADAPSLPRTVYCTTRNSSDACGVRNIAGARRVADDCSRHDIGPVQRERRRLPERGPEIPSKVIASLLFTRPREARTTEASIRRRLDMDQLHRDRLLGVVLHRTTATPRGGMPAGVAFRSTFDRRGILESSRRNCTCSSGQMKPAGS